MKNLITVIAPIYNESSCLPELALRLAAVADENNSYIWELILVDDGSTDQTWELIKTICSSDARFKGVALTRNFGHQAALLAGFKVSSGVALITIDSDLQDPPELIPQLVAEFESGSDVVNTIRIERAGETVLKRFYAFLFYRMFQKMVPFDVPLDSGDYRLVSERVKEQVLNTSHSSQYLRGQIAWFAYPTTNISYCREPRHSGVTKYPFRKSLALAANAVVSLSGFPLRVVTGLSFACITVLAAIYSVLTIQLILEPLERHSFLSQLGSVALTVAALIGLAGQAVVALYLGRLMFQIRRFPLFVIRELLNLDHLISAQLE